VTLTCSPDYLYGSRCVADAEIRRKGYNFDDFCDPTKIELERQLDVVIYRDIQKFLKRLREGRVSSKAHPELARSIPGAAFRFLCVAEAHQSGEPHYHLLIHEMYQSRPIRQRDIEDSMWPGGFVYTKLLQFETRSHRQAAWYICKYISKSGGRVRASKMYGEFSYPQDGTPSADREAARKSDGENEVRSLSTGFSAGKNRENIDPPQQTRSCQEWVVPTLSCIEDSEVQPR
jgi:hypothetical protein